MKKLILSILILILISGLIAQSRSFKKETGTTTNSWVVVETIYAATFRDKTIMIGNTGSDSNDLSWRIRKYATSDATIYKETTATDLSDGDNINDSVNDTWNKITIEVKTTTTDSVSTYEYVHHFLY